ncbi:MAG: ATP-binding cassette domain-containing protein, partial [Candidatus Latescibacterota bacterium]
RRGQEAARSHRRRSKRGLGKDNDARFRRNRARMSGKDGVSGRLLRQLDGRLEQARERLAEARVAKEHELGIWLAGSCSARALLWREPPGELPLGAGRRLRLPELELGPRDRVAVVGPNGSGKTTLVRHLVGRLDLPAQRVVYLPQEIDADQSRQVMAEVHRLGPRALGRAMTAVSRLGSRPERLLGSAQPSPGEVRKVLLALGIAREPHLVLMDEPTNHLDLPSIECLEEALAGCPCCLLLVSHDLRFLQWLTTTSWSLMPDAGSAAADVELVVAQDWVPHVLGPGGAGAAAPVR